jgi:PhnB protein
MKTVNIYLLFNGQCEEAFRYYEQVFNKNIETISHFGDMPPQPGQTLSEEDKRRVMHVTLPISAETRLMASDSNSNAGDVLFGNNFSVSIDCSGREEADRFYKALAAGGKEVMPMADTFWGAYFGMLTDKFGINWMINYDRPQ